MGALTVLRYNQVTSMISGRIGCELAVIALFCVVTIFFFPAMQGPYSVVHGPATGLLAARYATRLRNAIVQGARRLLAHGIACRLLLLSWQPPSGSVLPPLALHECDLTLRC
jgi:hypothetical protein